MGKGPLRPARTAQFKRDYRRCKKRGYDMAELRTVMELLIAQKPFDERHWDHELSGEWKGHRDCHIRSDWILIYRIAGGTITFERAGTHGSLRLAPLARGGRPQTGGTRAMKKYLAVVEETDTGFSAYSPDLAGCVSTGATQEDVERNMREAIQFHLDGLREEEYEVPEPHSYSAYVEVPA